MTPDAQTRAAMVEAALKAYWRERIDVWEGNETLRHHMSKAIAAAILAAEARGFKLVPKEPPMTENYLVNEIRKRNWPIMLATPGWRDGT